MIWRRWECEHGWLSKQVPDGDDSEVRVICLEHGCEMREVEPEPAT